jgi:hypothetical protein
MPFPTRTQPNGLVVQTPTIGKQPGAEHDDWDTWRPVDVSRIAVDVDKMALMPKSLQETDGYREDLDASGWQVTRTYTCDWSQVAQAMQWLYGYSQIKMEPDPNNSSAMVPKLRRVIPAQDPYRPWLYCEYASVERGLGAYIPDPEAFMYDAAGHALDFEGNKIKPGDEKNQGIWPGMIYAEQGAPFQKPDPKGKVMASPFLDGCCHIRARYRARPYPVANDLATDEEALGERSRYLQVEREYAIQSLVLSRVATATTKPLKFAEGPPGILKQQIPEGGVLLMPTAVYKATWHDVPFFIEPNLPANVGFVNSNLFQLVPGMPTWGLETVLCEAPYTTGPVFNAAGAVSWTYTFRFAYRDKGWNDFPAATVDANGNVIFDYFLATFGGDPNGPRVYIATDFNALFTTQEAPNW